MNKHIYTKLAITNFAKNKKLYLPYFLTICGSILFFYILTSLSSNPLIFDRVTKAEAFKGASLLCMVLTTGKGVTALFAGIFLLYANSFVLKNQKKQLGLYRVLGMERKHMVRLIFLESFALYAAGLAVGAFFGIVLDKLMLAGLFKIIGQTAPAGFYISKTAIKHSAGLAAAVAIVVMFVSFISIVTTKDIDLLKSDKKGEREPKNRIFLALIGAAMLLAGYWISHIPSNAFDGINYFFPAAILVIFATYILFTAGTIAVLKALKANKNYYYKTKHFISVSGLLYRMKQNAAGLATICVLSTSAIVVLSAGTALYANGQKSINEMYPMDVQIRVGAENKEAVSKVIEEQNKDKNYELVDRKDVYYFTGIYCVSGNELTTVDQGMMLDFGSMPDVYVITAEEYNNVTGEKVSLSKNEILLAENGEWTFDKTIKIKGLEYNIVAEVKDDVIDYIQDPTMTLFSKILIVADSFETAKMITEDTANFSSDVTSCVVYTEFNMNESDDTIKEFTSQLDTALAANEIKGQVASKPEAEDTFNSIYGGIIFIGAILGILFIMSTAMIIYYKQISEGYEDKARFDIMQKVGLTKEEIKKTIHSQILLVFFLPLVTAIIHAAVALKIVANCLKMVVIVHMPTFILSFVATCLIFSILYVIVYLLTSREYYSIVNS